MLKDTMHIQLKMEAGLKPRTPENADSYPIREGWTLQDLMNDLGLIETDVMLAFVDGQQAGHETPLVDGKTVTLCPAICGG